MIIVATALNLTVASKGTAEVLTASRLNDIRYIRRFPAVLTYDVTFAGNTTKPSFGPKDTH
jgi:hypothetical protein